MARRGMRVVAVAASAAMLVLPMAAREPRSSAQDAAAAATGSPQGTQHSWSTEQLLTSTVHEAWVLSGRNEGQFFQMVKELASMSAQKRGLVLPASDAAGKKAGELITKDARKDPNQLLYAVVDRAVMRTGIKSPEAAATATK